MVKSTGLSRWSCWPNSPRVSRQPSWVSLGLRAPRWQADYASWVFDRPRVEVIRRAPLGDPTIYRLLDTELCIRSPEGRLIEVVPEPDR